ncbi:MAG: methyl-accepting chemotaxis protein [Methanofollis sp.]|uniref:methyl-accepting chemotaxis protein n=1 Tax=Methanofollis sp. TaxID=2052835 RepID=UPI002605D0FC|nr:methyl-accepting chemotaxis protein [Methanofollis sp.]MDD4254815.1 methyl-accepting chemotaxis protein [Methanofollis sp.]
MISGKPGRMALFAAPSAIIGTDSDQTEETGQQIGECIRPILDALNSALAGDPSASLQGKEIPESLSELGTAVEEAIAHIHEAREEAGKARTEREAEIAKIRKESDAEIEKARKEHEAAVARLHTVEEETGKVQKERDEEIEEARKEYEAEIEKAREEHETAVARLHEVEEEIEKVRNEHETEIETVRKERADILDGKNALDAGMKVIFGENPMPMVLVDRDLRALDLNDAYCTLMADTRDHLLRGTGRKIAIKRLSGEDNDAVFYRGKKTRSMLEVTVGEAKKIVEEYGIPIAGKTERTEKALFVFYDMTETKNAEAHLKEEMAKIKDLQIRSQTIVDENPMPILLLNPKFDIVAANEAYASMAGIRKDNLIGMSARSFRVLDQKGEGLKGAIQKKKRCYGEVTVELPSGVHILEQYGIPIYGGNGNLTDLIVVYNDITERRKEEETIRTLMAEAEERAEQFEKNARELGDIMTMVAQGDISQEAAIGEGDLLARVKEDYNRSLVKFREILGDVNSAVAVVASTSRETSRGAADIGKATEQVALATQQSSEGTRSLLQEIEEIRQQVTDLSASIEEIAGTTQEVMNQAVASSETGREGAEIGKVACKKMEVASAISEQSVSEINDLNTKMHEITKIIKLINEISNQTNLLALNAAIEAARAGEHGRGFSVVAGEIRNLAGDSKHASEHIEDLIASIQKDSEKTAASMRSSHQEIRDGIESVNAAIAALAKISAEIDAAARTVTEITRATDAQAQATNTVMEMIVRASENTKENLNRVEDMAALAEEVSASTQEVGSAAQELTGLSSDLKKKMDHFTIN